MAAGSISHSFLGGIALKANGLNVWAWIAFGFLALLGAAVFWILWPTEGWLFRMGVQRLLADYVESDDEPATIDEMHRDLAWYLDEGFDQNEEKLLTLHRIVKVGVVLLVLGSVMWFGDLVWG